MTKLSTKDIPASGSGISKKLQPGNQKCKILSVELKPFTFKPGAYELHMNMVGPDLGPDFQGFPIDKNDPSLGNHTGQVGRVKSTEWAYADGETKSGVKISRDIEIMKFINNLCISIGKKDWMDAQDNKHETIESLVEAFNNEKPFKDMYIDFCIAGKEYVSNNYTNYDMFLPKTSKSGVPFYLEGVTKMKLIPFDENVHIIKKKVSTVSNFDDGATDMSAPANDFEL